MHFMNEKQSCCNLDCPLGKVPSHPLTQPCISLLELLNDSKNGRKVGSAGNLLSSRKTVVGEQIAIIVTILNTKKLS